VNPLTQSTIESSNDQDLLLPPDMEVGDGGQSQPQLIAISRLLWPKRRSLAKATLIGLVVSACLALIRPHMYETTVQLMPPDSSTLSGASNMVGLMLGAVGMGSGSSGSSTGASSSAGGLAGAVGDLLGAQRPGPLLIGILSSRTLSDRIIDRFDLRKVYGIKTYKNTRKKLLSRVDFKEDKKSGLIGIAVEDHDPARSTAIAQAYIDELNALLSHVNNSAASREREFLERRLVDVNSELESASKDLSEFSSKNATLDPEDQGKAMLDAAAMLQGQLVAAKSELSGLEQIYTGDNVRVRSLRAHIAELEQQVNDLGGKGYGGSSKLDQNDLYPSIRQLPVLGRQYADLYRRAKIDETVFQLLTEAYEMAKVQEVKDTPSAKVLDAPRFPEKPSELSRPLVAILGAFLTFMFTAAWIVVDERWSQDDPYRVFLTDVWLGILDYWKRFRVRLQLLARRNSI